MSLRTRLTILASVLLLTLAALTGPALAQSGRQSFETIFTRSLRVTTTAAQLFAGADLNGTVLTLDADADTTITVDTDDQIDFAVADTDVFQITATGPALSEGTVVALEDDGTITPLASYQPITSTAAVTASATTAIANGTLNGQVVCLVNENASDAIIIPDTANTNLSGAATLGADDVLCVIWDGADWLEISQVDN